MSPNEWRDWLSRINKIVSGIRLDSIVILEHPYVTMRVGGKDFCAFVDTGAVVNLIGATVAWHLRSFDKKPDRSRQRLRLANDTGFTMEEHYDVRGEIGEEQMEIKALYVLSLTANISFGMRTISELGLVMFGGPVNVCVLTRS